MVSERNTSELEYYLGKVLILVLVEDGLGVCYSSTKKVPEDVGLNPCFSGGWSRRAAGIISK